MLRVGTVCYATSQGLGHLAKSFYDHGIITDPVIHKHPHPSRPSHFEWYPADTPVVLSRNIGTQIDELIKQLDAMIFFETPFDWNLLDRCSRFGVKTILVPMYEWTPINWPVKPDVLFCPSLLDQDMFLKEFPDSCCPFLPIPVETKYWKLRTKALRFLHNAGNIGHREHKGTRQLLEAVPKVCSSEFCLTIRGQDVRALSSILEGCQEDPRVTVQLGEIPYDMLWDDHDVYVAPEKLNGLSLPLQESFAAGMMVMTTDRYPQDTWLPNEPLIPPSAHQRARISGSCREFNECTVEPEVIAKCIDHWFGLDIERFSLAGKEWAHNHSWETLKPVYQEQLNYVVKGEPCHSYEVPV